jgi:hypothetical protein
MLAARAPGVGVNEAAALAHQLTAQGLGRLVPLPPVAQQTTRTDIAPRPLLFLGSGESAAGNGGKPQREDHAVPGFDYDGVRISVGATEAVMRQTVTGREVIVRDLVREQAANDALAALGFRAPPAGTALGALTGVLQLAHANDWLHFARQHLPLLREAGWLIEQDRTFRFDLAEVEDWYADVDAGSESASAWFDLELGIVVNGVRVALLPVLLQLIRSAPQDFDAAALDAYLDDDLLIARLPGDMQVGLPWGRIKPILSTLGELYFTEQTGDALRLPMIDAARLAELEANAQLRWAGAEQLREMGRQLRTIGAAPPVAVPLGLRASLRPYQRDDAVATELPAKTEMVREVELSGAQRDLYETMRVAMDKKVRDAIASKGVARSQIIILDALLKLRQVCCDPRLVKLAGHDTRGAPSAKLAELMEMVVALLDEGRKILVFSQFTSMLALIEAELRERAIGYALLTGDTKDRAGQVAAFQQGKVPLFLISLKAGGVGLNLTAADTVIHCDPWWNPRPKTRPPIAPGASARTSQCLSTSSSPRERWNRRYSNCSAEKASWPTPCWPDAHA